MTPKAKKQKTSVVDRPKKGKKSVVERRQRSGGSCENACATGGCHVCTILPERHIIAESARNTKGQNTPPTSFFRVPDGDGDFARDTVRGKIATSTITVVVNERARHFAY